MPICNKCNTRTNLAKVVRGFGNLCPECTAKFRFALIKISSDPKTNLKADSISLILSDSPKWDEKIYAPMIDCHYTEVLNLHEKFWDETFKPVLLVDENGLLKETQTPNILASLLWRFVTDDNQLRDVLVGDCLLATRAVPKGELNPYSLYLYELDLAEQLYTYLTQGIMETLNSK